MSSETLATAGLVTYDIYKSYINPRADSKQLVMVSHITVVSYGLLVACIAIGLNHAGFSVNYLITAIGIFVDSAIVPMACTILWKKQSQAAVVISPILSSIAGIMAWLLTTWTHYGVLTIATTSEPLPLVAGNMMALCGPLVLTPLITYLKPADFQWDAFKKIEKDRTRGGVESDDGEWVEGVEPVDASLDEQVAGTSDEKLVAARNKAIWMSSVLCLSFLILWPIPMYGTGYGEFIPSSLPLFANTDLLSLLQRIFPWLGCGSLPLGFLCSSHDYLLPALGR